MTRRLLVPIDATEGELAHTIITHTQNESRFDTAEIHFLSVVQPLPYYPALGGRHSIHIPSIDELVDDARKTLEKNSQKLRNSWCENLHSCHGRFPKRQNP